VRIESSVTSVTWIPSEAIKGMPKLPFELGVAHYDEPPPDVIDDLDALRERDAFREANELKAFVEVRDGRIVDYGYRGRALIGKTRLRLGPKEMSFAAVKYPVLQEEPEVGSDWVRFQQTAGGHMGLPAPRRVRGRPFFRIASASAWTTLQLVLYADGTSRGTLKGASPFPRHWVYDKDGKLMEKSATIDFAKWWRESHGERTPWGEEDSPALVTAVESEVERELSWQLMRGREKLPRREIATAETLMEQGQPGRDLFLLLDGALDVEVDGKVVGQVGPGAIVGERALFEGGSRTSTLRAAAPCRVAVLAFDEIDDAALRELAAGHRREER
jgi:hypothetical protein